MSQLGEDLRASNRRAFAEGSRKNLRIQWESFLLFCCHFGLVFLPASTLTLQLYVQFLSRSFKSVDSIRNYVSGVRTMHQILGFSLDKVNQFILNLTFKGVSRKPCHQVKQALPISPELLLKMYAVLDNSDINSSVFWCLFVFAFFLLARKSNLVPTTLQDLKEPKFLLRGDVLIEQHKLLVKMKWTKTIQFGQRVLSSPLVRVKSSPLCPVASFKDMISKIPAGPGSPLFVLKSGKPVTYNMYLKKLREILSKCDVDPNSYSTHSFRRGFASFAFRLNVSADKIQLLGDWSSDAYKKYLHMSLEDKVDIAKFISEHI